MIEARRPDIMVVNKAERNTLILDVALPGDWIIIDEERLVD